MIKQKKMEMITKRKLWIFAKHIMAMAFIILSFAGCSRDDYKNDRKHWADIPDTLKLSSILYNNLVDVAWKFDGFGISGVETIRKVKEQPAITYFTPEKLGVITFYRDGHLVGYTLVNEVRGYGYEMLNGRFINKTFSLEGTSVHVDMPEEQELWDAFRKLTHYEVEGEQLKLYYDNDQKYLLFHKVE